MSCWPTPDYRYSPPRTTPRLRGTTTAPRCCTRQCEGRRPMPDSKPAKPLDGFRVLDFTQNVAGPLAGQVLADLGAEVIKIEAPGGEAARQITAVLPGRPPLATYFLPNNRGKKSVTADLTDEDVKQQILS